MKRLHKLLLLLILICFEGGLSTIHAQIDPNVPVLRTYVGEPNVSISFDFRVIDLDGDVPNVAVSGYPVMWLNPAVVDPNGMKFSYTGDVKMVTEGDFYLLVTADDRKVGDTRPWGVPGDSTDLPKQVKAYLKIEVRKKTINRAPVIR
jgi:hypothetical protein